jgi:acetyl esterase/lipase
VSAALWRGVICAASLLAACLTLPDTPAAQAAREHKGVIYATVDGRPLALDLYLPAGLEAPRLLVWVHGGAWTTGTRANVPDALLRTSGLAVASVDFRQSTDARFPAQVHDIKAAIRFLRAHERTYGYRADRIAIAGNSSGGHLAALVGVTGGHPDLEGRVGDHPDRSSRVQAIVSFYGASNLTTILAQSTPFGLNMRRPALTRLLGALPEEVPELARLASPVAHVDPSDPPLFLLHGDQDPQMPISQSHELDGAYKKHHLQSHLRVVHDAAHGGRIFYAPECMAPVVEFLHRALGP